MPFPLEQKKPRWYTWREILIVHISYIFSVFDENKNSLKTWQFWIQFSRIHYINLKTHNALKLEKDVQ